MENITIKSAFKKSSIISMVKIIVPGILFLTLLAIISYLSEFTFDTFSRDPIQLLNGKPYMSLLSNVGIIIWSASAAILFFSVKLSIQHENPENQTHFLFFAGLLTSFMLIDDCFLMHDVIFPDYLGIDEKAFYLIYGLSVIALFYFFRHIILDSDYILLLLAFILLAFSVIIDAASVVGVNLPYPYLVEDGAKFLGIINWFAYFTRTSNKLIKSVRQN